MRDSAYGYDFLAVMETFWLRLLMVMLCKAFISSAYTSIWIYTNEVYPTSVRSSAGGLSYGFSRIGSMLGAYVGLLVGTFCPCAYYAKYI